jgi:hypothetical protein
MKMKKILIVMLLFCIAPFAKNAYAQDDANKVLDKQEVVDQLTEIDPNIKKWFPRWKICEPDLQVQIYNIFLYKGYEKAELDQTNIEILAAPKQAMAAYELLEISCGSASMNAVEIDASLTEMLRGFVSGDLHYKGSLRGYPFEDTEPTREYCYEEIPAAVPLSPTKAEAIIDYLQPTNKTHVFFLSLFEQSVKIGKSGFWLKAGTGNDDIGYPYYYSGQNHLTLQRPLYLNKEDSRTRIPYLINFYLGGAYRHDMGLNDNKGILSWVPERKLNSSKSGYLAAGIDFHFPALPEAGIGMSASLPLQTLEDFVIEPGAYGVLFNNDGVAWNEQQDETFGIREDGVVETVPILQSSGKLSFFYHWWLNPRNPENYFRFDLGLSYCEVEEFGLYYEKSEDGKSALQHVSPKADGKFEGLNTYKSEDIQDLLYFKAEYRNQAVYPFGASLQVSNGILLGRTWLPLFGDWFYLEAKYSTPIRDARPYEVENFYMISPVIRLSI